MDTITYVVPLKTHLRELGVGILTLQEDERTIVSARTIPTSGGFPTGEELLGMITENPDLLHENENTIYLMSIIQDKEGTNFFIYEDVNPFEETSENMIFKANPEIQKEYLKILSEPFVDEERDDYWSKTLDRFVPEDKQVIEAMKTLLTQILNKKTIEEL